MTMREYADAARSVADLAAHFQSLQQRAIELRETFETGQRGYFTPTEQEIVRQLLVSYFHGRQALLERIAGVRKITSSPSNAHFSEFVIGFAAACTLVEAAMFLRRIFDSDAIVRNKLNEPDPVFGIPAGFYDQVQRSLTDPANVWALHQAMRFHDQSAGTLQQLHLNEPELRPAIDVIQAKSQPLRISKRQYLRARLSFRGRWFTQTIFRSPLSRALYAIQELGGRAASLLSTHPGHVPALPQPVRNRLLEMLEPGDILVVRKEHAVTNYFLPGYWPHSVLYLGTADHLNAMGILKPTTESLRQRILLRNPDQPYRVFEALADGVLFRPVDSAFSSDAMAVLRPCLAPAQIAAALERGFGHEGKAYDFDFDFTRADRMVCTEVVYRTYEGIGPMQFQLTRRAGRMTLSSEDLLRMSLSGPLLQPVALYCGLTGPDLITGPQTADALRRTLK